MCIITLWLTYRLSMYYRVITSNFLVRRPRFSSTPHASHHRLVVTSENVDKQLVTMITEIMTRVWDTDWTDITVN